MAERKTSMMLFGHEIPATDVSVTKATEPDHEYVLEDGSVIRVKVPVSQVLRVDDQHDAEGKPIYLVKTGVVVTVLSAGPTTIKKQH